MASGSELDGSRALVNLSIRLPKEAIEQIDALVERLRGAPDASWRDRSLSRGEVIRRTIEIGCRVLEGEAPPPPPASKKSSAQKGRR